MPLDGLITVSVDDHLPSENDVCIGLNRLGVHVRQHHRVTRVVRIAEEEVFVFTDRI